jgi:hypothetical protein
MLRRESPLAKAFKNLEERQTATGTKVVVTRPIPEGVEDSGSTQYGQSGEGTLRKEWDRRPEIMEESEGTETVPAPDDATFVAPSDPMVAKSGATTTPTSQTKGINPLLLAGGALAAIAGVMMLRK